MRWKSHQFDRQINLFNVFNPEYQNSKKKKKKWLKRC